MSNDRMRVGYEEGTDAIAPDPLELARSHKQALAFGLSFGVIMMGGMIQSATGEMVALFYLLQFLVGVGGGAAGEDSFAVVSLSFWGAGHVLFSLFVFHSVVDSMPEWFFETGILSELFSLMVP